MTGVASRFESVVVILALSLFTVHAASLTWTAAENREWNTTAANWGAARSNYVDGDTVFFQGAGAGDVFIGSNGIPISVAPAAVSFSGANSYRVMGGDITSGGINVSEARVSFVGYSNSLSFPGGLQL